MSERSVRGSSRARTFRPVILNGAISPPKGRFENLGGVLRRYDIIYLLMKLMKESVFREEGAF